MDKWNGGSLAAKYYTGAVSQDAASRTRHQWGFAAKLSDKDMLQLDRAKSSVDKDTGQANAATRSTGPMAGPRVSGPGAGPGVGARPSAGPVAGPSSGASGAGCSGRGPATAAAPPGSRLAELQAKEQQRMEHFKRSLGL